MSEAKLPTEPFLDTIVKSIPAEKTRGWKWEVNPADGSEPYMIEGIGTLHGFHEKNNIHLLYGQVESDSSFPYDQPTLHSTWKCNTCN